MTNFGKYELVDTLYQTEFGLVGTARARGDERAKLRVVKVFRPTVGDADARYSEAQSFLERAKIQQSLTAKGARGWAPIHESGRLAEGAFYVTDYAPLTVQKLIDAQVDIAPPLLHQIIDRTVAGLVELKAARGRAHGNLKPSNVLIVGQGDLSQAAVLLSDPASQSMAASVGEVGDRIALGQMIHELVLHRPFDSGTVWPLAPDAGWLKLGKRGDAWRRLCSDLLSPTPRPTVAPLSALVRQLKSLNPRRQGVLLPVAAVLMLFAAMAGGFAFAGYSARKEYCQAKREWLGSFAEALADPNRRALYATDPTLQKVVVTVDRLKPVTVRCDEGFPVPLTLSEYRRTRSALGSLEKINSSLTPARWPLLANAAAAERRFRARGWIQPADFLAKVVEGVRPGQPNLATRIDWLVLIEDFEQKLVALDEDWKALDAAAKKLQASNDPVIAAFGRTLRDASVQSVRLSAGGLEGLEELKANAALAARALAAIERGRAGEVDLERFTRDLDAAVDIAAMTPGDVAQWLDRLSAYELRPTEIAPVVAELRQRLKTVTRDVVSTRPEAAKKVLFEQARERLENDLNALEETPLIQSEINEGVLARRQEELGTRIDALLEFRRPQSPAEWVQGLAALETSSKRINDYWQSWKRVLPGQVPHLDQPGGPAVFETLKRATQRLYGDLEALDQNFPKPPADLPPAFASAAIERREQALDEALATIEPAKGGLDEALLKRISDGYLAWTSKLAALAKDFPLREAILDVSDRPHEKWQKDTAFWEDPLVRGLVEADVNRILRLQIVTSLPREELIQTAMQDTEAEVVLAAWRLLGQATNPPWPAGEGELETESRIATRLNELLTGVEDVQERKTALAQVRADAPRRWRIAVERASSEAALTSAVELRKVFGVNEAEYAKLAPEARFNLALFDARRRAARHADNEAMRPAIENLKLAAGVLGEQGRGADLLFKLDRLEQKEPFTDQNPGNFFQPQVFGVRLEFKRVEPRNMRPFYLTTTELTVEQVSGILSGARAWEVARSLPWSHPPDRRHPGLGPRGWEWTGRQDRPIGLAEYWLHPEELNDFPPEFLLSRFNKSGLKPEVGGHPTLEHPMNHLSAQTALYIASLYGCRLPTSREWITAYNAFERGVPRERWNLRDQTWETQREHVETLSQTEGRWPDAGAFVPPDVKTATGSAATAFDHDDGALYFRRVSDGGGGTFRHLMGNIAELVCDAPGEFDAWQDRNSADSVARFAARMEDQLFVIGGSALSAPEMKSTTPYPLGRTDRGYADVGIRLAFTAPVETLSERLKWVLLDQPYLWSSGAAADEPTAAAGAAGEVPAAR